MKLNNSSEDIHDVERALSTLSLRRVALPGLAATATSVLHHAMHHIRSGDTALKSSGFPRDADCGRFRDAEPDECKH